MQFEIIVTVNGQPYKMLLERIFVGDTIEQYSLSAGGKSVVLETNYRFLKRINSKKSPDWKIISGEVKNSVAFALTVHEIERHFKKGETVTRDILRTGE